MKLYYQSKINSPITYVSIFLDINRRQNCPDCHGSMEKYIEYSNQLIDLNLPLIFFIDEVHAKKLHKNDNLTIYTTSYLEATSYNTDINHGMYDGSVKRIKKFILTGKPMSDLEIKYFGVMNLKLFFLTRFAFKMTLLSLYPKKHLFI